MDAATLKGHDDICDDAGCPGIPQTIVCGMHPAPGSGGAVLGSARVATADPGLDARRDGLSSGLDSARPGDSRVGVRLDRLGRSLRALIDAVAGLKGRRIHRVRLEERIDTNSATGERVFPVFGAIAHLERRLISERTKDGLRAARKPGRTPVSATAARELRDLVARGTSVTQAARSVGMGRSAACRVLQNAHSGRLRFRAEYHVDMD